MAGTTKVSPMGDDEARDPCMVCKYRNNCGYLCFVYESYLYGAMFNPHVVNTLIRR